MDITFFSPSNISVTKSVGEQLRYFELVDQFSNLPDCMRAKLIDYLGIKIITVHDISPSEYFKQHPDAKDSNLIIICGKELFYFSHHTQNTTTLPHDISFDDSDNEVKVQKYLLSLKLCKIIEYGIYNVHKICTISEQQIISLFEMIATYPEKNEIVKANSEKLVHLQLNKSQVSQEAKKCELAISKLKQELKKVPELSIKEELIRTKLNSITTRYELQTLLALEHLYFKNKHNSPFDSNQEILSKLSINTVHEFYQDNSDIVSTNGFIMSNQNGLKRIKGCQLADGSVFYGHFYKDRNYSVKIVMDDTQLEKFKLADNEECIVLCKQSSFKNNYDKPALYVKQDSKLLLILLDEDMQCKLHEIENEESFKEFLEQNAEYFLQKGVFPQSIENNFPYGSGTRESNFTKDEGKYWQIVEYDNNGRQKIFTATFIDGVPQKPSPGFMQKFRINFTHLYRNSDFQFKYY